MFNGFKNDKDDELNYSDPYLSGEFFMPCIQFIPVQIPVFMPRQSHGSGQSGRPPGGGGPGRPPGGGGPGRPPSGGGPGRPPGGGGPGRPPGGGGPGRPPGRPPGQIPPRPPHHPGPTPFPPIGSSSIRPCLFRFTYIWPRRGNGFWAWLTGIGFNNVSGFRWFRNQWVFFVMDLNQIQSFACR